MPKKKPNKKPVKNTTKTATKKPQKKTMNKNTKKPTQKRSKKFLLLEIILAFGLVFGGISLLTLNDTVWATINKNFSKIWTVPEAKSPSTPEPLNLPIGQTAKNIISHINPDNAFTQINLTEPPQTAQTQGKKHATLTGYLILDYTGSETEKHLITEVLPALNQPIYDGTLRLYTIASPNTDIQLANAAKCTAKNTDRFFWEYLTYLYEQTPPFTYAKTSRANAKTDMSQYFFAKCYQNFTHEQEIKTEQTWLTENSIQDSPMLIIDGKIINPNLSAKNITALLSIWANQTRPPITDPDLDSYF